MYIENSIKNYLDDLAARKPAPGGGSAAALEAAMGCALMSMAASYTISNKRYKEFKTKATNDLKKTEGLRKKLLVLVDEDVKAYTKLNNTIKNIGKDSSRLDKAYKEACNVPYGICRITDEALNICMELARYANKNLVTDTAIAALMLESAFRGAKFNVYINLKFIKDSSYIEELHKTLSDLEDKVPKLKEEILHTCEDVIIK